MKQYSKKCLTLKKPETEANILFKHKLAIVIYVVIAASIIFAPNSVTTALALVCASYLYGKIASGTMPVGFKLWLPNNKCIELLSLCDEYKELEEYRTKVLRLNRRFTIQEFEMLQTYANAKTYFNKQNRLNEIHNNACKKLYLINE